MTIPRGLSVSTQIKHLTHGETLFHSVGSLGFSAMVSHERGVVKGARVTYRQ